MRSDITPGAVLPDYELTDHAAKRRGAFCPKDRRQTEGLLQLHREIEVGYCRLAKLVTISADINNPMIPRTIVLEPGLVIFKIYNLRQDLRAIYPHGKSYAKVFGEQD